MDVGALRQRAAGVGVTVRALRPGDRAAAGEALVACGAFTDEEVRVALEVLDAGVEGGLDGDYPLFAAEADGRFAGYVCVGPHASDAQHLAPLLDLRPPGSPGPRRRARVAGARRGVRALARR